MRTLRALSYSFRHHVYQHLQWARHSGGVFGLGGSIQYASFATSDYSLHFIKVATVSEENGKTVIDFPACQMLDRGTEGKV